MRIVTVCLSIFCISYLHAQEQEIELNSTNLPLIIINTNGNEISDEPKIMADMKIIYHGSASLNSPTDEGNIYSGKVGIEYRGSFSQTFPLKSYAFETRDASGNNSNVPILNMPEENDWILTTSYNDKVFVRNSLAFHLFQKMGNYAPRSQLCEVIINNEYRGIYLLCEKIKRDKNRLDIGELKPEDIAGKELTGGYIFKTDYYEDGDSWLSNFNAPSRPDEQVHFVYYYPEPDVIALQQKNYIKSFVNAFETRLYGVDFKDISKGYRPYIDMNSFIDYFLVNEISRNADAYKKSCYYYKEKDDLGGLLHAGPVWDFDWAWKNISDNCYIYEAMDGSNWAYKSNECNDTPVSPDWVERLLEDPYFQYNLYQRYTALRKNILSDQYINHYIDSVEVLVDQAKTRHYEKWPILTMKIAREIDEQPATFAAHIDLFKNWIALRLAWLDENMPGRDVQLTDIRENETTLFRLFPNPASKILYLESDKNINRVEIMDISGRCILSFNTDAYSFPIDISGLPNGIYIANALMSDGTSISRKLIVSK